MLYQYRDELPICYESGVYGITNLVNGKIYIGSAKAIRTRLLAHRSNLQRGVHDNTYLQRAWIKYGERAFTFSVLEVCNTKSLIELEQYWMDALESYVRIKGYNINSTAGGGGMEGRRHSEESCMRMSDKRRGITPYKATEAAAEINRGTPRSKTIRDKISASNKGKVKTAEHRAAIKASHWSKRSDAAEIVAKREATKRARGNSGRSLDST